MIRLYKKHPFEFHEKIALNENIHIEAYPRGKRGKKKRLLSHLSSYEESGDKEKFPKGVDRIRIIDKVKYQYYEKVTCKKTGKVIHECEESLLKHRAKNYSTPT